MVILRNDMVEDITLNAMGGSDSVASETFDVLYSCLRCGTAVSNTELTRLPEIKCICGFRVFVKVRPPVVKTIKAV